MVVERCDWFLCRQVHQENSQVFRVSFQVFEKTESEHMPSPYFYRGQIRLSQRGCCVQSTFYLFEARLKDDRSITLCTTCLRRVQKVSWSQYMVAMQNDGVVYFTLDVYPLMRRNWPLVIITSHCSCPPTSYQTLMPLNMIRSVTSGLPHQLNLKTILS